MKKNTKDLTFKKFQKINAKRSQEIYPDNKFDEYFYGLALAGEVGEACNILKKIKRGSKKLDEKTLEELRHELGDIATYLALLADRLGVQLDKAIVEKFNLVSNKYNSKVKL
jgi:NTP pyrophosphatase (non-canonical NTP hydrolase)